jgi:hypothetical protein
MQKSTFSAARVTLASTIFMGLFDEVVTSQKDFLWIKIAVKRCEVASAT